VTRDCIVGAPPLRKTFRARKCLRKNLRAAEMPMN
jgi:hypothetical protein